MYFLYGAMKNAEFGMIIYGSLYIVKYLTLYCSSSMIGISMNLELKDTVSIHVIHLLKKFGSCLF